MLCSAETSEKPKFRNPFRLCRALETIHTVSAGPWSSLDRTYFTVKETECGRTLYASSKAGV